MNIKVNASNPLVSVIITVYNRKHLIQKALDSVFKQSFKGFEIIIIDDGSTDKPEEVILKYFKKHNNLKFIKHSNRNTPLSLNMGIRIASGKYITFLDSDDEYKKNHLLQRISLFKKNKVDLVHSTCQIIGTEKDFYVPDARNKNKLIHLNDCVIGATLFGKAEVFRELGGFKDIYGYDFEFFKRASKKYRIDKIDILTYIYYRNSPDSVINILKKKINGSR